MALKGLGTVEGLDIDWWEGQLCHWVYSSSRLHKHHTHAGLKWAPAYTSITHIQGVSGLQPTHASHTCRLEVDSRLHMHHSHIGFKQAPAFIQDSGGLLPTHASHAHGTC